MTEKRKITMADIARDVGVSVSTVSRVINDDQTISPPVREKIFSAMKRLKYYKKPKGCIQKGTASKIVGVVIPNILNPFFAMILKGIESISKPHGFNLILSDSEDSTEVEKSNIDQLKKLGISGMIVIASGEKNDSIVQLVQDGYPVVLVDRTIKGVNGCSVTVDNFDGAYQAVKYLINLGHKRILYLAGPENMSTEFDRFAGYRKAIREESIAFDKDLVVQGNFHIEGGYKATKGTLEKKIPLTAIFASNDLMAFGAIKALQDNNLGVPKDISVVGYDDIVFCPLRILTTVAQPTFQLGKNAIVMLLDLIQGRIEAPQKVILRPSFVIRETCRRIG
jgi:DNA-binding LacI/PurR family transcriptional regulator